MPTKTVDKPQKFTKITITNTGVRTLTGLNLEQAIAENDKRRWALAVTVSFN